MEGIDSGLRYGSSRLTGSMDGATVAPTETLLFHALLARAAELARRGQHEQAARAIMEAPERLQGPAVDALPVEALDLLARIHAQQGEFEKAWDFWTRALQFDPENKSYQAGLERIVMVRKSGARRPLALPVAVGAGLLLALVVLLGFGWWANRAVSGIAGAIASQTAAGERQALAMAQLRQDLRTLGAAQQAAATQLGGDLALLLESERARSDPAKQVTAGGLAGEIHDRLAPAMRQLIVEQQQALAAVGKKGAARIQLKVPGVSMKADEEGLLVYFDAGLFGQAAMLKPQAKDVLSALGKQLEPHAGRISVRIIGQTDDLPLPAGSAYPDNTSLAMARALAVFEYLRAATRLPANMFTLESPGAAAAAPYPNDTPLNRARNRTVVLRVGGSQI